MRARVTLPRVPWGFTSGFGGHVDREDLLQEGVDGTRGAAGPGWIRKDVREGDSWYGSSISDQSIVEKVVFACSIGQG